MSQILNLSLCLLLVHHSNQIVGKKISKRHSCSKVLDCLSFTLWANNPQLKHFQKYIRQLNSYILSVITAHMRVLSPIKEMFQEANLLNIFYDQKLIKAKQFNKFLPYRIISQLIPKRLSTSFSCLGWRSLIFAFVLLLNHYQVLGKLILFFTKECYLKCL